MKQLLTASIVAALLGACHFHSRSSLVKPASDATPTKVVDDTQPVVKQEGEPAPMLHVWSRASATMPMTRSSFFTSDGRTVGRFILANDVDVSFAKIAYVRTTSEEVKGFARRMLTDHTQIIVAMRTLASTEDITPSEDDAARDLRDLSTLQRDSLRALTGRAFDNAYVGMELDRHREMLSMIDDVLLPRARNSDLREQLASARPIIAAHIAHAEQLLSTLSKR